jgi:hypothetical protein
MLISGGPDRDLELDSPSTIYRRRTVTVAVGGVKVGSAHPIVVQSMT